MVTYQRFKFKSHHFVTRARDWPSDFVMRTVCCFAGLQLGYEVHASLQRATRATTSPPGGPWKVEFQAADCDNAGPGGAYFLGSLGCAAPATCRAWVPWRSRTRQLGPQSCLTTLPAARLRSYRSPTLSPFSLPQFLPLFRRPRCQLQLRVSWLQCPSTSSFSLCAFHVPRNNLNSNSGPRTGILDDNDFTTSKYRGISKSSDCVHIVGSRRGLSQRHRVKIATRHLISCWSCGGMSCRGIFCIRGPCKKYLAAQ